MLTIDFNVWPVVSQIKVLLVFSLGQYLHDAGLLQSWRFTSSSSVSLTLVDAQT